MTPTLDQQPLDKSEHRSDKPLKLEKYFLAMLKAEASDLHIKAGSPPHIRVRSLIRATKSPVLSGAEIEEMARELMNARQEAFFEEHGSIDLAHEVPGSDRFRLNIFRQRGQISISVRRVTREIPSIASLHLPPILERIAEANQGLVLLSGPTGCGKSTTIASMLEHVNRTRACHIVTIEDPIEYLYVDKKALVSQREIGIDVENFEAGLKYLMREDPDVVLIGEMRDKETFMAALQAAETGHLVFGTIHASSASQTIERLLSLFPPEYREMMRQSLAFSLRAVVCQRLLPSIKEGIDRVPAVEILLRTPSVRQLVEEGRESELIDIIRTHEQDGMQSFTHSLRDLIENDFVDPKIAYEVAPNVDELKMMLKGITARQSGLIGR